MISAIECFAEAIIKGFPVRFYKRKWDLQIWWCEITIPESGSKIITMGKRVGEAMRGTWKEVSTYITPDGKLKPLVSLPQ